MIRRNWLFIIGILFWSILTASLFEFARLPSLKILLNKAFNQPNPITAALAFILLGVIFYYIFKGIELGKKQVQ